MSRYQQAPYSDNDGAYGNSYGQNNAYSQGGQGYSAAGNQGGYHDEPYDDGYNESKYARGQGNNDSCAVCCARCERAEEGAC